MCRRLPCYSIAGSASRWSPEAYTVGLCARLRWLRPRPVQRSKRSPLMPFRSLTSTVFALAQQLFPGKGVDLSNAWRTRQFEYQWLRALAEHYADFWRATEDALVFAATLLKLGPHPGQAHAAHGSLSGAPGLARGPAGSAGTQEEGPPAGIPVQRDPADTPRGRREFPAGGDL